MSELNTGTPAATSTPAPSAPPPAAPAAAPSPPPAPAAAPPASSPAPKGAKVVSEREAVPDANASPESYTDKGPLTTESWKKKLEKYNKSKSTTQDKSEVPLKGAKERRITEEKNPELEAAAPEPAAGAPAETTEPEEEGGELGNAEPTTQAFKANPKFTAVGKEYELPAYLADALTTPEQEKEVKELYTKAMGLDHVKMRHQELTDKHNGLQDTHNEVVQGVTELKEIYSAAIQTQNPLLLNEFFEKLQIPPQVILQYAQKLSEFLQLDPAAQQNVAGTLEAHRRARDIGRQNQMLAESNRQAQVSARGQELASVLARPELAPTVSAFEAKYGPGSFRAELVRNGVYVAQTERRDISVLENVSQVMQRFSLSAAPAPGQEPAAPQVPPVAGQVPAAQPPAAAQPGVPPVIPAQPHRKVPTIPGVNGKPSSPTQQQFRSIEELKAHRKAKFGH